MANKKITDLTALSSVADGDELVINDVSDAGSEAKKITRANLLTSAAIDSPTLTTPTLTSPTLTSPVINTAISGTAIVDEDNMASNSDTKVPTQQSVKAYVDGGTVTMTNKTLTTPVLNGAFTGTATPPLTFYGSNFNAPRGFLLNGKIVPSVASNNLTVAIKGLDGNDPSTSNPVYCRIGDTVRSITSALSVTKNSGTNYFNAGSAELATKEIDYFVYLGYNATDGVVVGFARIPYAKEYGDFSATSTNEKYCAISTITNAVSGDDYEVVGRFAATLGASATYYWSVPTFTNINLIQKPIDETRNLTYAPTVTGFSGSPTIVAYYMLKGGVMFLEFNITGTSNATSLSVTIPLASTASIYMFCRGLDNTSTGVAAFFALNGAASLVNIYKDATAANWTASGTKAIQGMFVPIRII